MDLDQSFLSELPLQQRQKVCRQIRQKQIEKYFEFDKSDRGREIRTERGKNKCDTQVHYPTDYVLQDAVDRFDDREASSCLIKGANSNFTTGIGTSLLHKCAAEDNVSGAELLLSHGADVNILDDDWWSPLHMACSCDSVEVLQLLLNNGGDVCAVDVDGYFPIDHAADGTEAKTIMNKHLEMKGITVEVLHKKRQSRPKEFLDHIKALPLAVDVNMLNANGVTLLHVAAANGYKNCMKALFRYEPNVDRLDRYGWTPLHVAARFNQMKTAELLLKRKANPNIMDTIGCKPSAVTSSDQLRGLLMKYERRQERKGQTEIPVYTEILDDDSQDDDGNVYEEISEIQVGEEAPDGQLVGIFRINSKTVRTKHITIAKEDELLEARKMQEALTDLKQEEKEALVTTDETDGDEDDNDYVSSAIWKAGAQEQGEIVPCMDNDNLVSMATEKEDEILAEIQRRYAASQIYTYIGDVLIAVNPFKDLHCYARDISTKYHSAETIAGLPPHIYGNCQISYQSMLRDRRSQCHVISGESGSGKTETCKYIVQHLLRVSGSEETNLNTKINQVNPLLEAFGNAATVRNNNSSRFGKYVQLNFAENGKVAGANISEYLLEKSRVVCQGSGECNFHIFYWMMAGLSHEETLIYKLQNMENFRYLVSTFTDSEANNNGSDNKAKFWEVKECLKSIGFSSSDIQNMMLTVSTVLHLGEITFHGVGNNDAAQVTNIDVLKKVSDILEVSADDLGSALVEDFTVARGEQIKKERTVQRAEDCRDALAKTLYSRLFSWIVNGINQLIQPADEQGNEMQIGILDIFGFENFPHNSFEQMCINVANEQIQLYTNDNIFYKEQQDCLLEGVPLVDLNYASNQAILDLFLEKHTGVLGILDEESNFPKATDKSLATKLHQNSGKKHSEYYKTPKDGGLCFTVIHYAGSVSYNVTGMLEKNRDTLPNSVLYTMKTSNRLLIKELFQSRVTRTGSLAPSARQRRSRRTTTKKSSSPFEFFKKLKGNNKEPKKPQKTIASERKGPSTMAYHFRNSLSDLVCKLQSASPNFVRCIKPNTQKMAMKFDAQYVLAQLRYTGVSDIVKIRKFGYAMRLTYHELLMRYSVLVQCCLPKFSPMTKESKCQYLLQYYKIYNVKFGKTKVFFKKEEVDRIDQLTVQLQRKVVTAQSVVRGFLGRKKSRKLSSIRDEQNKALTSFLHGVSNQTNVLVTWMRDSSLHDDKQYQLKLKKDEIAEITKSLDSLDDVIHVYEDTFSLSKSQSPTFASTAVVDDDDLYDDAFSVQKYTEENLYDVASSYMLSAGETAEHDKLADLQDNMNGHMHRGLPPTPTQAVHMDSSRPPPCPREMYSQGMYASIAEQDQMEYRRHAPPPPKRNPETRLSTASVSSTSSYEEDISQHHHHHHGEVAHNHHQRSSPHHATHGSPVMKPKFDHEPQSPQSPSHGGSRPFSYGAPMISSPKLKPAVHTNGSGGTQNIQNYHQNGHSNQTPPQVLPNYQYDDMHSAGSPAASYGKYESAFHAQPHRPPPQGPPPPPPPGGHYPQQQSPQSPHSPHLQRHSVASIEGSVRKQRSPGSPKMTQKLSQRSQSVPSENIHLPAPPPPVSVRDGYLAAAINSTRPASPPLPPPPPEMLTSMEFPPPPPPTSNVPHESMQYNQYNTAMSNRDLLQHNITPVAPPAVPKSHHQLGSQPRPTAPMAPAPPPPPIATIPKKNAEPTNGSVTAQMNNMGYNQNRPVRGGDSGLPTHSPLRTTNESSVSAPALLMDLNKIQLRKTGGEVITESKTDDTRTCNPTQREVTAISGIKLRPTSARLKLLEKDGLKTAAEAQAQQDPSPPPPPLPSEQLEPLPPGPAQPQNQVSPVFNMFEKKVEVATNNNQTDNRNRNQGDTSKNSKMEINLDDIDLDEIPGYVPITRTTPVWKRDMIEKKNQEKIEEYIRRKQREQEEAEKWKNVPAWKRKLMQEKAKEMEQKSDDDQRRAAEEAANKKKRAKEAEEEKRNKLKQEKDLEMKMQEELQDVPAWKREIMMKRGGAIKNWGDEREDINDQEMEDGDERLSEGPADAGYYHQPAPPQHHQQQQQPQPQQQQQQQQQQYYSDPNKTFTQKARLVLRPQTKEPTEIRSAPAGQSMDADSKLEEEWDSLPAWKKEIMMKRGGAIKNWGDENEKDENGDVDH